MHYTRDQLPFTMYADSKVPLDIWGKHSGEARGTRAAHSCLRTYQTWLSLFLTTSLRGACLPAGVMACQASRPLLVHGAGEGAMHIWRNHLLAGCVDKAAFGKHGLLHVVYELYGAERTSTLTAALSRLFTAFLQRHGFTCGMSDVFLVDSAERERAKILQQADLRAMDAAATFAGMLGPMELVRSGMKMVSSRGWRCQRCVGTDDGVLPQLADGVSSLALSTAGQPHLRLVPGAVATQHVRTHAYCMPPCLVCRTRRWRCATARSAPP
jgi:hypothetical protein